jgi:glycerol-3-phosphate dehydrogenase
MWAPGWRERVRAECAQPWDLIVIGGGITGAGVLREAARAGLRTLLVEGRDWANGASSRSSKLVHGGLRYLRHAQFRLTLEALRERERLLREGAGLVHALDFVLACFADDHTPAWVYGAGLALYDLLALRWSHRQCRPAALRAQCPALGDSGLRGGFSYFDAETDDARLVLRLIGDGVRAGGAALNYVRAERLLRRRGGAVCGVGLRDEAPGARGRTIEALAPVVINTTGVWADEVRRLVGGPPRLRHLRGSHLLFPAARLPLECAVSFLHPADHRPVFAVPWEGLTLFGTTDVDHADDLWREPHISPSEFDYLLEGAAHAFPGLGLDVGSVQATFAGVRPVVDTGQADPSRESREHVLWTEHGLLTVTGGKLTTFRLMAHQALRAVRARLPGRPVLDARQPMLDAPPPAEALGRALDPAAAVRLAGRLGAEALKLLAAADPADLEPVAHTPVLWGEVRWAARAEGVCRLDDLLLRRTRLGLLLPEGGRGCLPRLRAVAQPELGWSDARWQQEVEAYAHLWEQAHGPAEALPSVEPHSAP